MKMYMPHPLYNNSQKIHDCQAQKHNFVKIPTRGGLTLEDQVFQTINCLILHIKLKEKMYMKKKSVQNISFKSRFRSFLCYYTSSHPCDSSLKKCLILSFNSKTEGKMSSKKLFWRKFWKRVFLCLTNRLLTNTLYKGTRLNTKQYEHKVNTSLAEIYKFYAGVRTRLKKRSI